MSKHLDNQLKRRDRVIGQMRTALDYTERLQKTHADYLESLTNRVFISTAWQGLTQANREYCRGWLAAKQETMERERLEWRMTLDGRSVTREDVPEGRWCDLHAEDGPRGFYWKGTEGTKPWSTGTTRDPLANV